MNQKGFINIILIIIVVAIIGVGAYFVLSRQAVPSVANPTPSATQSPASSPLPITTPAPTREPSSTPRPSVGPSSTPAQNAEKIIKKVGEQENSFLIQKINADSVEGLWYQAYPVATGVGVPKTLHIGDDIGYVCEGVSEKLSNIDFSDQSVTFTKIISPSPPGGCPICLASNTLIETPSGLVLVKDLSVGMPIWTTDKVGHRVAGIIIKTSKTPVPLTHQMVHLVLDDGRELFVSPGHPTIDGRRVGDLLAGDFYDGAFILSAQLISYNEGATYDILSSGETGFYWANGVLLGSTLRLN